MSRVGQSPRSCSGKGQGRQITSKNVCEGRGLGGGVWGGAWRGATHKAHVTTWTMPPAMLWLWCSRVLAQPRGQLSANWL